MGEFTHLSPLTDPVYQELRRLAQRLLSKSRRPQDPDPTELVHECYLRLGRHLGWQQFSDLERTAYEARALSNTLIDMRRAATAEKRGGLLARITLDEVMAEAEPGQEVDLLALSEALEALAKTCPNHAEVVVLRYFGGLSVANVASLMDISEAQVTQHWKFAQAWLSKELLAS
jgi:RNA polymerase sigma-70 factor (ECF subfamily)